MCFGFFSLGFSQVLIRSVERKSHSRIPWPFCMGKQHLHFYLQITCNSILYWNNSNLFSWETSRLHLVSQHWGNVYLPVLAVTAFDDLGLPTVRSHYTDLFIPGVLVLVSIHSEAWHLIMPVFWLTFSLLVRFSLCFACMDHFIGIHWSWVCDHKIRRVDKFVNPDMEENKVILTRQNVNIQLQTSLEEKSV